MLRILPIWLVIAAFPLSAGDHPHADHIANIEKGLRPSHTIEGDKGWTLEERMKHYGVPGVSIAVIQDYKVAWYKVYGKADAETGSPVTPDTLFQAGSVSKPVAAFGAMVMVQDGKLALNRNVNDQLKSWKVPDNEHTRDHKVTLAQLLSHRAGLTVHGFRGYAPGETVPTTIGVLDGKGNSPAVRVFRQPGKDQKYSGGGYTVAQLLMVDVAGKSFPELMDDLLIHKTGMTRSTFDNPLKPAQLKYAAAGVLPDKSPVRGKRHTYPEMAAAGLWSTAEDLARFAIEVQLAVKGQSKIMTKDTAETMLTPASSNGYALGFNIQDLDGTYFGHGGWDEGFCALLEAHKDKGYGVAVMINGNFPAFMEELKRGVGIEYGWDGFKPYKKMPIPKKVAETAPGRYRYNQEQGIEVTHKDGRLFMRYYGNKPQELFYIGDDRFIRREQGAKLRFTWEGEATNLNFILGDGSLQSHKPLTDDEKPVQQVLEEGNNKAALEIYRTWKEQKANEGSESHINRTGINMVQSGSYDQAILVFRINCELYPTSANTWDSLAYAYNQKGDKANAIKYYKKALTIDPHFESALAQLAKLQKE